MQNPFQRSGKALKCRLAFLSSICVLVLISWVFGHQAFKTRYTVNYYHDDIQLQKMNLRIKFTPPREFKQYYSSNPEPSQNTLAPGLAGKIDGMLQKVCHLLPKCPASWPLLHIYLLEDSEEVRQRLFVFSPFSGPMLGHEASEGFFLLFGDAIFLSLEDLREGILAHEMAHFILCQYNPVPSGEIQEQWAQYVETQF